MRISDWSSDVCSSDLIKPSRPETGYGYIEVEEGAVSQSEATDVRCFVEKPDLRTAEGFFQSGRHCWNAGIFLCSAKTLLREMERFAPETLQLARMAAERAEKGRTFRSEVFRSELQSLMRISYRVFCLQNLSSRL